MGVAVPSSSARTDNTNYTLLLDTLSPSSLSSRGDRSATAVTAIANDDVFKNLNLSLPSAQVNEGDVDLTEIEQISLSSDDDQENLSVLVNKPLHVFDKPNDAVDWKSLYLQSYQVIRSLETLNNNLNEALMHYTGQKE
jgi:hypothetical protein